MWRVRTSVWLFAVGCGASLATGCIGDKDISFSAPSALVVDGWSSLQMSDFCSGSKVDLCSSEKLQSIESVTVDDPRVLEIVETSAVPAELTAFNPFPGIRAIHGLRAGKTRFCIVGHFDDGTNRQGCADVTVAAPDHLLFDYGCESQVASISSQTPWITPGSVLSFSVRFAAGSLDLEGAVVRPIDSAGLTQTDNMRFSWTSPAAGGSIDVRSAWVSGVAATLRTYTPDEITSGVAGTPYYAHGATKPGDSIEVAVAEQIGDKRTCNSLAVTARSETPEICLGPKGEQTWSDTDPGRTSFSVVAEGTCRLSLGVAGGNGYVTTLQVPLAVVNPADDGRLAVPDDPCPTKGERTCTPGRWQYLECRTSPANGTLSWVAAGNCADKICDFVDSPARCAALATCIACR
ncbi:MAG TPA: hypothetical protein VFK05_34805 [Polyangiaceae bacterium]|nr:hypothetical protein [Polyangiaceae bacterium]